MKNPLISCREQIHARPASMLPGLGRRIRDEVTPWVSKTQPVWKFLHFLRYGLPYRLGITRTTIQGLDLKRINLLAVEHCNNSCRHCSTSSPFASRKIHQASAFLPWLEMLVKAGVQFENISITGGEPFLHPNLPRFIDELHSRFPDKQVGVTTNFFWANENKILELAPQLGSLKRMLISEYPNIVIKLGGKERFQSLVEFVREVFPHMEVSVADGSNLISWEMRQEKCEPRASCCTSDCYVLRPDGQISHCAVGVGLDRHPDYSSIIESSKERLYDLKGGVSGLVAWAGKYPFDLCSHCSLWRGVRVKWDSMRKSLGHASTSVAGESLDTLTEPV